MDYDLIRHGALILLGILFYAVLVRGLFNATEPRREEALDIAEELCRSEQVSEQKKKFLYARLGELHSSWQAWKLVFSLLIGIFRVPFIDTKATADRVDSGIPKHLRARFDSFKTCWVSGVMGNSPLAVFIFAPLALFMIAFFLSISAMARLMFNSSTVDGNHTKAVT